VKLGEFVYDYVTSTVPSAKKGS